MPTAGWLRRVDLPVDAAGRSYIDPPNLDQILDQFLNWRGNVNGGGYTLSNAVLDAAIKTAAQTPWLSNIDAAGYYLSNLRRMGAQQSSVELFSAVNPTATNSLQLILRENTANPDYGLSIGMIILASAWRGVMQMTVAGVPADLLLNPSGGNVGIGTTSPTAKLHIAGTNVAGADAITALLFDRYHDSIGDSTDIVWKQTGAENLGRISLLTTNAGERAFVFYAQTGGGDGSSNEVMRIQGNHYVGIGTSTPGGPLHVKAASGDALINIEGGSGRRIYALISAATGSSWAPAGYFVIVDGDVGAPRFALGHSGEVLFHSLRSSNPGAGTKQIWYDPADGNRVKFAP